VWTVDKINLVTQQEQFWIPKIQKKPFGSRGSTPYPTGGAYSAPSDLLAGGEEAPLSALGLWPFGPCYSPPKLSHHFQIPSDATELRNSQLNFINTHLQHDEIWQRWGSGQMKLIARFLELWSGSSVIPCSDMHQSFSGILVKWFFKNFPNSFSVLCIHCVSRGLGQAFCTSARIVWWLVPCDVKIKH